MIFVCIFAVLVNTNDVSATTTGQVLIVFDDGNAAQYTTAFNYMQTKGILGTAYVNGATIGQSDTMTLANLQAMDTAGWCIANHGYIHQSFFGITDADITSEIQDNIQFLTNNGLSGRGAYHLAYPGGYYGNTLADVERIWGIMENLGIQTGRTINGDPSLLSAINMYQVPAYVVQNTDTVATITSMIDQAKTGSTVVLLFHDLVPKAEDQNPNYYQYVSSNFQAIIDYIYTSQISTTTIDQLYTQKQNSLLPSTVTVAAANGFKDATTDLIATFTATGSIPGIELEAGQIIHFYVDKVFVGNAIVDNAGNAILHDYTITQSLGSHNVVAKYVQGTYVRASEGASTLQVNIMPTTLVVNSASGLKDTFVNLVATLTDINGKYVVGRSVSFTVDGLSAGSALTNEFGVASVSHKVTESIGIPHTILASFTADDKYDTSSGSNTLTPGIIQTNMVVSAVTCATNSIVDLVATLKDNNNQGVSGKSLEFFVDDISKGFATTNANGVATLSQYTVSESQGSHIIKATFAKDDKYDASTSTNTLTVPDTTAPTASDNLKSGLYNTNKLVTLSMSEPGSIFYSLNGGTPSALYTSPINIAWTCNLKYFAKDMANNPSPTYTKTYSIDKVAPKVSSTTPSSGKTKVSRTSSIVIRFSENIYATTNWSKIFVKNTKTNKKISISKKLYKNTLTIKTSKKSSKTKYQVYIPQGSIKDTAANKLSTSKVFTFKTA